MVLKCLPNLLLLSGILLSGCGEYITFSKDSRARGIQYLETNQYDEAKGAFRDAVRQNPRDYQSYFYLGQLYARNKEHSSAISHYKTSMAVQNVTLEGRHDVEFKLKTIDALSSSLATSDIRDSEINKLEKSAAESKTSDEYLSLAKTFAKRGDADSAIEAYAQAGVREPNAVHIFKEQGLYLEQIGHKPLAEQALRRAYRLDDKDAEVTTALRRLGVVPGPAIKEDGELAKPLIPRGPLPDWMNKDRPKQTPTGTPSGSPAD
ncbi:MAG: tetratricopeptide repeat protein [Burkholderiales bacterium]|nr:tetratricopeptide repeat protein [Phycisphaerae bacterium]